MMHFILILQLFNYQCSQYQENNYAIENIFVYNELFIYLLVVFQHPFTGVCPVDIGTVKE